MATKNESAVMKMHKAKTAIMPTIEGVLKAKEEYDAQCFILKNEVADVAASFEASDILLKDWVEKEINITL